MCLWWTISHWPFTLIKYFRSALVGDMVAKWLAQVHLTAKRPDFGPSPFCVEFLQLLWFQTSLDSYFHFYFYFALCVPSTSQIFSSWFDCDRKLFVSNTVTLLVFNHVFILQSQPLLSLFIIQVKSGTHHRSRVSEGFKQTWPFFTASFTSSNWISTSSAYCLPGIW